MEIFKKLTVILTALILLNLLIFKLVKADDCPQDLSERITCLEKKISATKNQEKSLSSEINLLDEKISLTKSQINFTQQQLGRLTDDISSVSGKIGFIEDSLAVTSNILANRIAKTYIAGRTDPMVYLLTAADFSDFWQRLEYLRLVQKHDRQLLLQMAATRKNYRDQKDLLEGKKKQIEKLSAQLKVYKVTLDKQNREKQQLLIVTRNDEQRYQTLLVQALAEKQAIERALVEGVKVGPVKTGDPIAVTGNTGYPGCSTGKHLHFEIRKNNIWIDPSGYLSPKSVIDEEGNGATVTIGNSNWPWPLQDTIRLTQRFGRTSEYWRYTYSGGIHTGFDMVSTSSDVIRAPKDGILYSSSQLCGSSIMNVKYIDHGEGIISFYLHVE